jgi:hypothetical protein
MNIRKITLGSFTLLLALLSSCAYSQKIEVSKATSLTGDPHTLIYSLPKTRIDINFIITKTTVKAGPYAAFADKYLSLGDVPTTDSENFEIANVSLQPVSEPDPDNYYAVTFKSYPSNLDKIFSMTSQGLMLDLQKSWKEVSKEFPSQYKSSDNPFEKGILEPNIEEKTDTLYKTILTDASFVKVPIYKKSVVVKTDEDKAKLMADQILKVRKKRLKILTGDSEYHPDGTAAKVILEELMKQEEEYLTYFKGKQLFQTLTYSYSFNPAGSFSKELFWFNSSKGVFDNATPSANAVSFSLSSPDVPTPADSRTKPSEKVTNSIYFRVPVLSQAVVKIGTTKLAEAKIPVYQTSAIKVMPLM